MTVTVVRAPSRIACCLLDLNGEYGRIDGCLGFALEEPYVEVVAERAEELTCEADSSLSAAVGAGIELAERLAGEPLRVRLQLTRWIRPHVGLGHKTQTMLAVALAALRATGGSHSIEQIAYASGRGGTSGAGLHSFIGGGIVVDAGHRFGPSGKTSFAPSSAVAGVGVPPLTSRLLPSSKLRVVLGIAPGYQGISGPPEIDFFTRHCPVPRANANELIANVYMRLLPAFAEGDLDLISDGVECIQGSHFKRLIWDIQPDLIKRVRHQLMGWCPNVGLSSMGPTMYTITDQLGVEACAHAYKQEFVALGLDAVVIASRISPHGATVSTEAQGR